MNFLYMYIRVCVCVDIREKFDTFHNIQNRLTPKVLDSATHASLGVKKS